MKTKGFTLIELLIVLGILAILSTTVVLVLNPMQLLAETRDVRRISDLKTISSVLSLYLVSAATVDLDGSGAAICLSDWWSSSSAVSLYLQPFQVPTAEASQTHSATPRATDGTGWVPVNLGSVSGGSPVSALPVDPNPDVSTTGTTLGLDGTSRFYAYACDAANRTFELNTNMESAKYGTAGTGPEDDDGGTSACSDSDGAGAGARSCTSAKANSVYEVGTDPSLDL